MIKVTVWNEYTHEKNSEHVRSIYPDGIHGAIAAFLGKNEDIVVNTATLDDPECGLTEEVLKDTDVLVWWGHMAHHLVPDEVAERVQRHVLCGMGFIALHSAHMSKPFLKLVGTTGTLKWRDNDKERVWCCNPGHPIAEGIPEQFVIEPEEMYGEYFDIPQPDELIFISWFKGGEVFRSGVTFRRGHGKVFYFRPGHESNPTYHHEYVQKVITNAVRWAKPTSRVERMVAPQTEPLE